jgi:hypothetical protein
MQIQEKPVLSTNLGVASMFAFHLEVGAAEARHGDSRCFPIQVSAWVKLGSCNRQ